MTRVCGSSGWMKQNRNTRSSFPQLSLLRGNRSTGWQQLPIRGITPKGSMRGCRARPDWHRESSALRLAEARSSAPWCGP